MNTLFWQGNKLKSSPEVPFAYDIESEVIKDKSEFPKFVLASVYDGETSCIVGPHQLVQFFLLHSDSWFVGHNVAFDFHVTDEFFKAKGEPNLASQIIWDAASENRVCDTMLLDQLIWLATGKGEGGEEKFFRRSLEKVVKEYTKKEISKTEGDEKGPFRLRFAELLEIPVHEWEAKVNPGFFEYARTDTKATWEAYQVMHKKALGLQKEFLPDPSATTFKMYPDAIERYGVLTEAVQVKGSIALAKISRNGMRVDQKKAQELEAEIRKQVDEFLPFLEKNFPQVLKPYKKKEGYMLTKKAGVPSLKIKEIQKLFEEWSPELGLDEPIKSKGKKEGISTSVKDWGVFKDKKEFIKRWAEVKPLTKRLEFFSLLKGTEKIHTDYNVLVRTGRVSAEKPNITQLPKAGNFRDCFIASEGYKICTADYSAIELRTLGVICHYLFGKSILLETIKSGVDPHAYTASMFADMSIEEFMKLKKTDPEKFKADRQSSKAVNFGVPGGLGAFKLSEYAKSDYNVTMSEEEAGKFRSALITKIYPELSDKNGYLASSDLTNLARNLKLDPSELFDFIFSNHGNIGVTLFCLQKVLDGDAVKKDGTPYKPEFVDGLWKLAECLVEMGHFDKSKKGYLKDIENRSVKWQLIKAMFGGVAITLTGRIRKGVRFTEEKNTPFQSLAADGGKMALFEMVKRGKRVIAFIHDECVVEVKDEKEAEEVEIIMKEEMEKVLNNIVPIQVEYRVANTWVK